MHVFPFTAPTFCPDGFIGSIHWQYCYKLIKENVPFSQAENKCGKLGSRLLAMRGDLVTTSRTSRTAEFDIFEEIRTYYASIDASQCKYDFHIHVLYYSIHIRQCGVVKTT